MATKAAIKIAELPTQTPTTVSNCQFTGVRFDEGAIGSITVLAQALLKNAEGLATLAHVFNATGITIESLLKIEPAQVAKKVSSKKP